MKLQPHRATSFVLTLGLGVVLVSTLIWQPLVAVILFITSCSLMVGVLPVSFHGPVTLGLLAAALAGYAFFGRTFSYLGVRPLYIGEILLGVGIIVLFIGRNLKTSIRSRLSLLLIMFAAWCAVRTVPYISRYGFDALRDGAIWGYGAFALIVAGVLTRSRRLPSVPLLYGRFIQYFLPWAVIAGLARGLSERLPPELGVSITPLMEIKAGDTAVHLAGVASFLVVGLHRLEMSKETRVMWAKEWFLWSAWLVAFFLFGSLNRGGLLSVLCSLAVVLLLEYRGRWAKLTVLAVCATALFIISHWEIDLGFTRKISPAQVATNLMSIAGANDREFEGTRQWRLNWWSKVINYTLYGEYFWSGKGFGVNLADEDGFQVDVAGSLRSPHNGHLTILARAGVPGFLIWVALQSAFSVALLRAYRRARHCQDQWRAAMFLWVLAYWTAFTVNGAFDVYLEGPQGGIWFWCLFGLGIALLMCAPQPIGQVLKTDRSRWADGGGRCVSPCVAGRTGTLT